MPRYEFSEDGSNKFWEITLKDLEVVTHYGRIGSAGQSTTKSFKTEDDAKKAFDKLIGEKTKKGYVLKGAGGVTTAAPAPAAESLVARLDRCLKVQRPNYYARLQPGATAGEIAKFEKKYGAEFPPTFKEFLKWKGTDRSAPSERFMENWGLMNLPSIIATWTCLNELREGGDFDDNPEDWWNAAWIPFLENGGGDNLCVDVKGAVAKPGAVVRFWHDEPDRDVVYKSIDDLLEEIVPWMEKGKWDIDDGGLVDFGPAFSPSEEAIKDKPDIKPPPPAPPPEPKIDDPKTKATLLVELPKMNYGWAFYADVSPDGKHTVYALKDKSGEQFVLDGKPGPKYEAMLGPWFDSATGILVYREGKKRKWRWHIGDAVHDVFEQSGNPVFSPDGKHVCYSALKNKKAMLVVDGKPRSDTYDSVGGDLVWSPDGSKCACTAKAGGKEFVVVDGVPGPVCLEPCNLVFSPDGSKLAYLVKADQPILQYHVVCGDFMSELINLPTKPGFTPTGHLWYAFTHSGGSRRDGIQFDDGKMGTDNTVDEVFFHNDGSLAGYVEYGADRRSRFVPLGMGAKSEVIGSFHEALFHDPNTFAFVVDKMTPQQAMVALASRMVMRLNGRESEEYDIIKNPRISPDGTKVTFGAVRERELWWVEMAV